MNLRKVTKASLLFVVLPIFVTVVGGYIVERIKGTPADQIAAAMWWPVGAALGGTSAWLRAPAPITDFDMLVILAAIVWMALVLRRLRKTVRHIDMAAIRGPMGKLAEEITRLQEFDRKRAAGLAEETPQEDPKVAEGFEPNRIQMIAAKALIDCYPSKLQLPYLAEAMKRARGGPEYGMNLPVAPQGEIAREMEDMQQKGVATIDDPNSVIAYYGLTRHGRDFMLEKLRPRPRAPAPPRSALEGLKDDQPAIDPRRSALRNLQDILEGDQQKKP